MYNRSAKSELKTEMRNFLELIHDKKAEEARAALPKAYKEIDQVAAKGVIHHNTAARRKARLAKALDNLVEAAQA
jgi:small subunit ribosomal protein S20